MDKFYNSIKEEKNQGDEINEILNIIKLFLSPPLFSNIFLNNYNLFYSLIIIINYLVKNNYEAKP